MIHQSNFTTWYIPDRRVTTGSKESLISHSSLPTAVVSSPLSLATCLGSSPNFSAPIRDQLRMRALWQTSRRKLVQQPLSIPTKGSRVLHSRPASSTCRRSFPGLLIHASTGANAQCIKNQLKRWLMSIFFRLLDHALLIIGLVVQRC